MCSVYFQLNRMCSVYFVLYRVCIVYFVLYRVCYTAARGGHMLEMFSYVNMKRMTPAPAVAFQVSLVRKFVRQLSDSAINQLRHTSPFFKVGFRHELKSHDTYSYTIHKRIPTNLFNSHEDRSILKKTILLGRNPLRSPYIKSKKISKGVLSQWNTKKNVH